jgi:ATP:corrinoid adenosyltransferase
MTQQELPQTVTGTHQIPPDILDRAHQVTEILILHRWHEHERQLTGSEQPR